jgi:TonB family protein
MYLGQASIVFGLTITGAGMAAMYLPIFVMFLACVTMAAAADSAPTGTTVSLPRYAFKPLVEDYYPDVSRILKEQGTTKLRLCYGDRGSRNQVAVDKSSSFARLDEAAVRWGKAVRIVPGLFRGQPQPGCVVVPVKFSLEKSQESPDQGEDLLLPEVQVPPILDSLPLPPRYPGRFIPLGGEA